LTVAVQFIAPLNFEGAPEHVFRAGGDSNICEKRGGDFGACFIVAKPDEEMVYLGFVRFFRVDSKT